MKTFAYSAKDITILVNGEIANDILNIKYDIDEKDIGDFYIKKSLLCSHDNMIPVDSVVMLIFGNMSYEVLALNRLCSRHGELNDDQITPPEQLFWYKGHFLQHLTETPEIEESQDELYRAAEKRFGKDSMYIKNMDLYQETTANKIYLWYLLNKIEEE